MSAKQTYKGPFYVLSREGEGTLLRPTWHDRAIAIFQVVSGEVALSVGTELLTASAGDIFVVPQAVVYSAKAKEGHASLRGLIFETSILEQNMASLDSELLYMFEVQSRIRVPLFRAEHPIYARMLSIFTDAIEEYAAKDVCYKLPIRADIYLLMTVLLRHYGIARGEQDRVIYHNVLRLRPVLEHIKRSYRQKLTIAELCGMLHVSGDHFTRMFKESIGRTPVDYINAERVVCAERLLCDTDKTLAEIAEEVGFCNANYFHKIFKQYMEESPLSYRKAALAEDVQK